MATIIKVTPDALKSASKNIDDLSTQYKTQYEKLTKLVDELSNDWQGEDNQAFARKVHEFDDDVKKMFDEMTEYSNFLEHSATSYTETQEDATKRAQALAGNYNG